MGDQACHGHCTLELAIPELAMGRGIWEAVGLVIHVEPSDSSFRSCSVRDLPSLGHVIDIH